MRKMMKKLPIQDQKVRKLHIKIWKFFEDIYKKDNADTDPFDVDTFFVCSSYAEAILSFQKEGINPDNWSFITENEKILVYAEQLRSEFLIKILSIEESKKEAREVELQEKELIRNWVLGSPMISNQFHQGSEISDKEWRNLQPELKNKFKAN